MSGSSQIIPLAGYVESAGRWWGWTVSRKQSLPCIVRKEGGYMVNRHIHQKTCQTIVSFFLLISSKYCCRTRPGKVPGLHIFSCSTIQVCDLTALHFVAVFPCSIKRLVKQPNLSGLALKRQEIGLRQDACSFSSRGHKNPGGSRARAKSLLLFP